MLKFLKRLFGSKPKVAPSKRPAAPARPPRPGMPMEVTVKNNLRKSDYYRRNGSFYYYESDSLVEDLLELAFLVDMFDVEELDEYGPGEGFGALEGHTAENDFADQIAAANEERETVVSIDRAVEDVRATVNAPEPTYTPSPSYDSGSSYDSSDSSDSSDSGGSDD